MEALGSATSSTSVGSRMSHTPSKGSLAPTVAPDHTAVLSWARTPGRVAGSMGDTTRYEVAKARRLANARGLALIGLALSISLDELAIGFSLGLGADLTIPTAMIAVIAIQTLVVSQLGLSLGVRISERLRECIERLAGPILIFLGVYLLTEAFIRIELVTTRDVIIIGIIMLILVILTVHRRLAARTQTASVGDRRATARGDAH